MIYDKNSVHGKCAYRIIGDEGENAWYGTYPLYGFHKIPDRISYLYADNVKDHSPAWTIFPDVDDYPVGAMSRLVDYAGR